MTKLGLLVDTKFSLFLNILNFLNIKKLPYYKFEKNIFTINSEYLSLLGNGYNKEQIYKNSFYSELSDFLFDYQKFIIKVALLKRKFAIFADTGLGKTNCMLEWLRKIKTKVLMGKKFLIVSPLMVLEQTRQEQIKFYKYSDIINLHDYGFNKWLDSDSNNVQRMQILAMGSELGKGFSELNDPLDQHERFKEQQALRDAGDEEAQMMDEDFVEALEYGMPPAAGFGYSERLFAMLMDKPVKEMQFFLLSKPETKNSKKIKQDFSKKIAIILNKDIEQWQVMNALAQMSAYIGNKIKEGFSTGENFVTKDDVQYPRNSQYPIITLGAEYKEIISLVKKVRESGLLFHVFIREMIETTDDEKIIKILSEKEEGKVEYLGVGIFGEKEKVTALTQNLKLWK